MSSRFFIGDNSASTRWVLLCLSAALAAGFATASARAQDEARDPDSLEAQTVEPLAVAEIVTAAETELLELGATHARVERTMNVSSITEKLPELREALHRLEQGDDLSRLSARTRRELMDIREQWREQRARTTDQLVLLDARAAALAAEQRRLLDEAEVFRVTRDFPRDTPIPPATAERANEVLAAIASELEHASQASAHIALAQRRMSALGLRAGEVIALIDIAEEEIRDQLFHRTHPVLPLGVSDGRSAPSFARQRDAVWDQHIHSAQRFFSANDQRLRLLILLILTVLGIGWGLNRRYVVEDSAKFSITWRPVASSLLLAISFLASAARDIPGSLLQVLLLTMCPLVLRLAPSGASKLTTVAVLAFMLDWTRSLIADGTALARVATITVAVTVCCAALIALRDRDRATAFRLGKWFVAAVAATSFVLTTIGFVPLGSALLRGACATAYFGVTILTLVEVISDIAKVGVIRGRESALFMVRSHGTTIAHRIRRLAQFTGSIGWLFASLRAFDIWSPLTSETNGLLSLTWTVGELTLSLGDVLVFSLGLALAFALSAFIAFVLEIEVLPRTIKDLGTSRAISMISRYVLSSIGFLLALAAVGIELSQLSILVGALGVGIGFGLQNIVNNFVSGLILIFERPIKLGDTITAGDLIGEVTNIGIRASTVTTIDGAEVIMPNANLISSSVVNWTLSNSRRRVTIPIGVAYGSDLGAVHKLLERVVTEHKNALGRPLPQVLFVGFGDSSLNFEVLAWAGTYLTGLELQSTLGIAIYDALNEAGVEIPFPQTDVHVRDLPPQTKKNG